MKRPGKISLAALVGLMLVFSCVEPYDANIPKTEQNVLVVDGFFNSTDGTVNVSLSRTRAIGDEKPRPETGAVVFLDEEFGKSVKVAESSAGQYTASGFPFNVNKRYRLRMVAKSRQYVSDYVAVEQAPPIDSLGWRALEDGVGINVNTHGPGNTGYYRWTYEETWKFRSFYQSYFDFVGNEVVYRSPEQQISTCWKTVPSSKISVGTTTQYSENRISDFQLVYIPKESKKIALRYSILVKQMALDRTAYEYWRQLQKTSENLGGLFDPLPGRVPGNIRCLTLASEIVVGYFSAGSVTQARMFLDFSQIPVRLRVNKNVGDCQENDILGNGIFQYKGVFNITSAIYDGDRIIGYYYSTFECTDCRYDGGALTPPPWWQ